MNVERLDFVIQCEHSIDLGDRGTDEFHRGTIAGLQQVRDWVAAGDNLLDRIEEWQAPETMIREQRQFLAGFISGMRRGADIVRERV